MLNRAIIMGRLTRDPELRRTQSGKAVTSFTLACDRNGKDTDFLPVVAWNSTAEFVTKHFGKGRLVACEGRIHTREYTDKDGNKRTATEVVADSVHFCDSKPKEEPKEERTLRLAPVEVEDDDEIPF